MITESLKYLWVYEVVIKEQDDFTEVLHIQDTALCHLSFVVSRDGVAHQSTAETSQHRLDGFLVQTFRSRIELF